jgi:hypothetical protein
MYAVIASGGKQEKVAEGQRVQLELLGADEGSEVSLTPVMLVDGDTVLATADELQSPPRSSAAQRVRRSTALPLNAAPTTIVVTAIVRSMTWSKLCPSNSPTKGR